MKSNKGILRFLVLLTLIFVIVPQLSSAQGIRREPLDNTSPAAQTEVKKNTQNSTNKLSDLKASILQIADQSTTADTTETEDAQEETQKENPPEQRPQPTEELQEAVSCQFEMPEAPLYSAKYVAVRKKGVVENEELFETVVFVKNLGNTPWFSADSGCPYLVTNLGTDKMRDRESTFYTEDLMWNTEWAGPNRVAMETKRVDPDQLAVFRFWSRAPQTDGYYREFFTPVIEGVTWLDGATFHTDTRVGEGFLDVNKKKLLKYIEYSGDLTDLNLEGDKSINVQISTQRMQLKIGDVVIRDFPVSTGTNRTPTPLGTTQISHKQEVRVAAGWPHYIMPKWMTYRGGGYGIHALPSLANDNGVFWREALNHIGTRRSHGCIRLLPGDAVFAYEFADIGTTVNVTW